MIFDTRTDMDFGFLLRVIADDNDDVTSVRNVGATLQSEGVKVNWLRYNGSPAIEIVLEDLMRLIEKEGYCKKSF